MNDAVDISIVTATHLAVRDQSPLVQYIPNDVPMDIAANVLHTVNAAQVRAAGVDGIAVVSAVRQATDPCAAAAELRAIVDEALDRRRSSP